MIQEELAVEQKSFDVIELWRTLSCVLRGNLFDGLKIVGENLTGLGLETGDVFEVG